MKRLILALTICLGYVTNGYSCSSCGCSATNQYLGILPQSKINFIGLQYQLRQFASVRDAGIEQKLHSDVQQNYQTLQVWSKYNISNRVQLFAFLPYVANNSIENKVQHTTGGIGDVSLLANYLVLGEECKGGSTQHKLLMGGGIKLPTGKYDTRSIELGNGSPNIQPGTKSYDFILNTNYTIQRNKTGINTDASYALTTPGVHDYKYGNRLNVSAVMFQRIDANQFKLIPQLGAGYEVTGCDYDNYKQRWKNKMTGGSQLFASVGMQAYYKKIGLQFMYHKPVLKQYASGAISNKFRLETGLYLLF